MVAKISVFSFFHPQPTVEILLIYEFLLPWAVMIVKEERPLKTRLSRLTGSGRGSLLEWMDNC